MLKSEQFLCCYQVALKLIPHKFNYIDFMAKPNFLIVFNRQIVYGFRIDLQLFHEYVETDFM